MKLRLLRVAGVVVAVAALGGVGAAGEGARSGSVATDDGAYLDYLDRLPSSAGDDDAAIDTRRLARLLFGLAATLSGGQTNVSLLQNAVDVRDAGAESVRATIRREYDAHAAAVRRFSTSVSVLLDDPTSATRLFEALVDGHAACWRLDRYARLTETYGAGAADLVSILTSTEACEKLRRAAFSAAVRGRLVAALERSDRTRWDVEALEEEVRALERLIEDLRSIDEP